MNTKILNLCLISKSIRCNNSILLNVDTTNNLVTSMRDVDKHLFRHVFHSESGTINDLENVYANIFLLNNLNVVGFDENENIRILYKLDGTTQNYEE